MNLIDKDTLVAEIERQIKLFGSKDYKCSDRLTVEERLFTLNSIKKFIDTLEVKEVDLEKEIDDWYNTIGIPVTADALKETARHFVELGLKVQKGE